MTRAMDALQIALQAQTGVHGPYDLSTEIASCANAPSRVNAVI